MPHYLVQSYIVIHCFVNKLTLCFASEAWERLKSKTITCLVLLRLCCGKPFEVTKIVSA